MAMLPPPRYTVGGQSDQMPDLGYYPPGASPVARSAFNMQGLLSGIGSGVTSPLFGLGMGLLSGDTNQAYQNALAGAAMQQRQQAMAQQMQMQQAQIQAQQAAQARARQQAEARQALAGMYDPGSREAAMIGAGIMPEFPSASGPTSEMQNFAAYQQMSPEQQQAYGQWIAARRPPGTTVNVGQGGLKVADLSRMRHPETGMPPPLGSTPEDIAAGGYILSTPGEAAQRITERTGFEALQRMDQDFFSGDLDMFAPDESGLLERGLHAGTAAWEQFRQSDPRYATYEAQKQQLGGMLARISGEKGAMTEEDVARALALFPDPRFDTRSVARKKWNAFKQLIEDKTGYKIKGSSPRGLLAEPTQEDDAEATWNYLRNQPGVNSDEEADRLFLELGY